MRSFLILFIVLLPLGSVGQVEGMPLYRFYEPQEYQAHRQNWAADQSADGTMYFANNKGLLSYDGAKWNLIKLPNKGHIRSLDVEKNRIYVGANNDFGFFERKSGQHQYQSLLSHLPDSLRSFGRVWTTLFHKGAVYFQTDTFILRVDENQKAKVWTFDDGRIWKLILLADTFYVLNLDEGLYQLNQTDNFEKSPFAEAFLHAGSEFLIPIQGGLLFERNDSLMRFDGKKTVPFANEASSILTEYSINTAIKNASGDLMVATLRKGGVVTLDQNGKLKRHLNAENGFANNVVRGLFEDRQNAIWFALDNGISRLDVDSPLSFFDAKLGLNGTVLDIQLFRNKLYAATTDGLMQYNGTRFERVHNIKSIVWDLDTLQNQMLAVTSFDDTFVMDKNGRVNGLKHQKSLAKEVNRQIVPLIEDKQSAIILFHTGIFQIRWDGKNWITEKRLENLFRTANNLIQSKPGTLWIGTNTTGLYRINYQMDAHGVLDRSTISIKNYGKEQGVAEGYMKLFCLGGDFYFKSDEAFTYHKFNEENETFEIIPEFAKYIGLDGGVTDILKTETQGTTWFSSETGTQNFLVKVQQSNGRFVAQRYPLSTQALGIRDPYSNLEFHQSGTSTFFGGSKGMGLYDLSKTAAIATERVAIKISKIITKDSVLGEPTSQNLVSALPYNKSEIRLEFTSTNYKDAVNKYYQYLLEGYDEDWSPLQKESHVEFNGLPPGDYTFKVKALNDYFVESPEASVSFTVNRPWYWNKISIPLYILALGLMTYLFGQWRTRSLKLKNLKLEETVNGAVAETKRQAAEIAELYEVKNKFFANISHELRTPLTLILGPSNDLIEDTALRPAQKNKLTFINNNAKRLLRLINQLLDLSKLEAGKLDLKASQQNIVQMASTLTKSFESMAVSRNVRLKFEAKLEELFVFYDTDKLEKVLINLLSNTMKFTQSGDSVTVSVDKEGHWCIIRVKDTGIGINDEQLPYIFDRFFQADHRESREHEGTGIGLSLTKELVELHGGSIEVLSELGKGSVFTVRLPLGREHLQEHQLATFKPEVTVYEENFVGPIIQEDEQEATLTNMVLLVEDNSEMRTYIKSQLKSDYNIIEAENGVVGFEMALEHVPDLIISDVMMPQMDGTELCKKIKANRATSHIPVILLTAKASEEDKIKGLNLQADAYLAKPFNKLELEATAKNLITNRKKLQKRFAQTTLISPKEIAVTSMEQQFLEKLVDEIETQMGNETFGVEQLAAAVHLSRSQLHRKMISIADQTPSLFIRNYRLERAKSLLEQGAGRVADIAFQVGFSSPSYFTKCYVEAFGKTPTATTK